MFCHVAQEQVLGVHDVGSVYHVPLLLKEQGLLRFLQKRLNLNTITVTPEQVTQGNELSQRWRDLTIGYDAVQVHLHLVFHRSSKLFASHDRMFEKVHITLVGKYTALKDSYLSVIKSLEHAALRCGRRLVLDVRLCVPPDFWLLLTSFAVG